MLVPGVNDGVELGRSLGDLYGLGEAILSVSVVPVALTEFSKHHLLRQPTADDCRAALGRVGDFAARALEERGFPWCFGADDLYLQAGEPLPPAEWYGEFEQRENGVGAVRYLQTRIAAAASGFRDLAGKRIGVVTGTAMAPLMPQVLEPLAAATGARFEIVALENTLFGSSVTTAGLLPGDAFRRALEHRGDLDLALLPAEAVNDDMLFMDDLDGHDLAAQLPMPMRLSYDFVDALANWMREAVRRNDGPMSIRAIRPAYRPTGDRRGDRMTDRGAPTVAIIGRPNVGKSTLFNRLIGGRVAIVDAEPGVTRDRNFAAAEWNGRRFWLVDTGGLVPGAEDALNRAVRAQVELAIGESDVLLFLVDVDAGVHPADLEIAETVRKAGRPFVLVANKSDHLPVDTRAPRLLRAGSGGSVPGLRGDRKEQRRPSG